MFDFGVLIKCLNAVYTGHAVNWSRRDKRHCHSMLTVHTITIYITSACSPRPS